MSATDANASDVPDVPGEGINGTYYLAGDSDARATFVADLRSLTDYLAAHPEVPVPRFGWSVTVIASGTDEEKFSQVDAVSRILDELPKVKSETNSHYQVKRSFGLVRYEFVAISADQSARHQAWRSYADSVEPETSVTPVHLVAEDFPAETGGPVSCPARAAGDRQSKLNGAGKASRTHGHNNG